MPLTHLPVGIIIHDQNVQQEHLILCQHTMPIALLEFLSQPQNRLGAHFCAKVSVEGRRSAPLKTTEGGHIYQQSQCKAEN